MWKIRCLGRHLDQSVTRLVWQNNFTWKNWKHNSIVQYFLRSNKFWNTCVTICYVKVSRTLKKWRLKWAHQDAFRKLFNFQFSLVFLSFFLSSYPSLFHVFDIFLSLEHWRRTRLRREDHRGRDTVVLVCYKSFDYCCYAFDTKISKLWRQSKIP